MGDNITRPDHYCDRREYEPKDVILDWGLNFNLGSAVKYISRAGRKGDKLEDLQKAKQFLQFEIEASEIEAAAEINASANNCANALIRGTLKIENVPKSLKALAVNRIVERIDNDELDCLDISTDLYREYRDIRDAIARQALRKAGEEQKSDIGMTCKEAKAIGDAIAKGLEDGIKEAKEKYDEAEENLDAIERKISWYVNGITSDVLNGKIEFEDVPEDLKHIVIDKIAQEVLDNQCDITMNMPTIELRDMVIDRIVERINNGELDRMDIPTDTYEYCKRIREAIANREYRKAMDAVRKYAEDTEDTVSINFEFEVDPDIDTDTVNVHVHIKNKED